MEESGGYSQLGLRDVDFGEARFEAFLFKD
jgi:hypothetical protein